jgi:hypothetical protein
VHQAGFDTGGQHYIVPAGDRKRESYIALLIGEIQMSDFFWLKPAVGGTLRRESSQSALFYGLESDLGWALGTNSMILSLRGFNLPNGFSSFWARDEFAVVSPVDASLLSSDPNDHSRYLWGAAIIYRAPLSFGEFFVSVDESLRFLDGPFKEKEWDRNQVLIGLDIKL